MNLFYTKETKETKNRVERLEPLVLHIFLGHRVNRKTSFPRTLSGNRDSPNPPQAPGKVQALPIVGPTFSWLQPFNTTIRRPPLRLSIHS